MIKNFWIILDTIINPPPLVPDPPETMPADTVPNYDAAAEMDRLQVLKLEYTSISDAIEKELADLETEYNGPNTSEKRRSTISKRRLTLYRQRAGNTSKLFQLDKNIETLYNQIN
jgi:hypothetical protein